ncbi:rCG59111 [Rattus norvegicus]|uniref:RCG59111 n=1 Tax=Rattus norvegicus TaxID=10116 RepID=A6JPI2_RAT|nr:rCG59111 [Rattus norvegicus]
MSIDEEGCLTGLRSVFESFSGRCSA